ncbi:HAD-IA family hydrolase [Candidatus Dependentiae bacterium]|nr:HAD-IA family hydrolase [Candidatus Dependentiae bacterium]
MLKSIKKAILCFGLTIGLINTLFTEKEMTNFVINEAHTQAIKTIIFDIGDVLFTSSRTQQIKSLLILACYHPTLIHTLLTLDVKKELFDMLDKIPAISTMPIYYQNKPMPLIMTDLMIGRPTTEIISIIEQHLESFHYSTNQKRLFQQLILFIFQPEKLVEAMQPLKKTMHLAHAFKKHGYNLHILSNWDPKSFALLHQKYPLFFKIFDEITISGKEGLAKPDPSIYIQFLSKHNLDPKECLFIDDEPNNIKAAGNLGILGIEHTSLKSTCQRLQDLGILKKVQPSNER